MNQPRISVALCTYNAGRFIDEYFQTLLAQTLLPCELVVSDDRSKDDTLRRVRAFADRAPFPVVIHVNEKNLGIWKNREQSFRLCTGDLIAVSDFDDPWMPDKLEKLSAPFAAHPRCGLTVCNGLVVDQNLKPIGHTAWDTVGFTPAQQERFERIGALNHLLPHAFFGDNLMMFRADLRALLLPIPPGWDGDAWVATATSAVAEIHLVKQCLIQYRQHASNMSGSVRKSPLRRYREAKARVCAGFFAKQEDRYAQLLERLTVVPGWEVTPQTLRAVRQRISFARRRRRMRENVPLRWPLVAGGLISGEYKRFGRGWKTVALDLLI